MKKFYFFFHRADAAFFAISDRLLAVKDFALAAPPLAPPSLPNATAAAFLPSGVNRVSVIAPVEISTIILAR